MACFVAFPDCCKKETVVVTCGDWDLKTMLPRQLTLTNTKLSPKVSALLTNRVNIKFAFAKAYNKKPKGMAGMLEDLGLNLEGRHHSGIDDSRNIARITAKLIADGYDVKPEDKTKR